MFKHMLYIFLRDLKVNLREFLSGFIFIAPALIAIFIQVFVPEINSSTVSLAMIEGHDQKQIEYYKNFASVDLFQNEKEIRQRVDKRDNLIGVIPFKESYKILVQGNEPEFLIDYAKLLKTYYEEGVTIADSQDEIIDFGKKASPLKRILLNAVIMLSAVMGGMLISLNIVEEKVDNTISAINVTTVSKFSFIMGKSMIGVLVPILGSILAVIITGFYQINFLQLIVIILISTILAVIVGFVQGVTNNDIMSAAGSVKMLFLPLAASIAAAELLAQKWQYFFYWSPFYWAYKGNEAVLSNTASWGQILLYAGIILVISIIVYILLLPKIKKGLK